MREILNQIHLLRFNYALPLHQVATKNKIYKKWSEFRLSGFFHSVFLLIYTIGFGIGIFSGLFVSSPAPVKSAFNDGYGGFEFINAQCGSEEVGGIKFDPTNEDIAYFTCLWDREIHKIDLSSNTVSTLAVSTTTDPLDLDITADGQTLYVSSGTIGSIDRINLGTETLTNILHAGGFGTPTPADMPDYARKEMVSVLVSPSGGDDKIYVATNGVDAGIFSYDTATGDFESLMTGISIYDMAWKDNENIVFSYFNPGQSLSVLNVATKNVQTPLVDAESYVFPGFYYDRIENYFWAARGNSYGPPNYLYKKNFSGNANTLSTIEVSDVIGSSYSYNIGVDVSSDKKTLLLADGSNNRILKVNLEESIVDGPEGPGPDIVGPVISDILVTNKRFSVHGDGGDAVVADISWKTSEPATSKIWISGSCLYPAEAVNYPNGWEQTKQPLSLITSHLMATNFLKPSSSCSFYVESVDGSGNVTRSQSYAFSTPNSRSSVSGDEKFATTVVAEEAPAQVEPETIAPEEPLPEEIPLVVEEKTFIQKVGDGLAEVAVVVQGAMIDLAKKTPEPVARSFPFVLFTILFVSAAIFMKQASTEAEQVTIKKQIVEARKAVADEKNNFIMLSSHYIRTPITIIVGGVDLILSKLPKAKAQEVKSLTKSLAQKANAIASGIENNANLRAIDSPSVKKETFKIYLSPFFILPILIIAGIVGFAVTIFKDAGVYQASTLEIITYVLVFLIAVQVFTYFFRKRAIQRENSTYFDQTIKFQLEMDESRAKFMVDVKRDLEKDVQSLKKTLGSKANKTIKEGCERIEEILEKMGYLATLKIKDVKRSSKKTSLNLVVNHAVASLAKEIKTKKIKIHKKGMALRTNWEEGVVTKIITEILSNAIKFSPSSGEVFVECSESSAGLTVTITDSGRGVSAKEQRSLFKPFSRVSSALDFNYEGLGLGLYYARSLANMIGGDVALDSRVGKGTKVTIII